MFKKRGFTLIELLIVIAVIAILISIALPRFKGMQTEAYITQAKSELQSLERGVESYYMHNNNAYPAALTDLLTQIPLMVNSIPDDPFAAAGTPYAYVMGGTGNQYFIVYSIGPNANGSAAIALDAVAETNGASCIYVSNCGTDTQP